MISIFVYQSTHEVIRGIGLLVLGSQFEAVRCKGVLKHCWYDAIPVMQELMESCHYHYKLTVVPIHNEKHQLDIINNIHILPSYISCQYYDCMTCRGHNIITSRVSGRGNRIGPVWVCVCVCVCNSALSRLTRLM